MSKTLSAKMSYLHWDQDLCSNCMSCMIVCAERHIGMSAPSRALIRIHVGLFDGSVSADYCRQCQDASCAAACPTEAIAPDGQSWHVDETLCIGCGECVDACPYQAIRVDVVTGVAAKCDLCRGSTRCIEICPTTALTLE